MKFSYFVLYRKKNGSIFQQNIAAEGIFISRMAAKNLVENLANKTASKTPLKRE